ncbi:MAG: hypothetical protein RR252_04905 [Longicatena sp.]
MKEIKSIRITLQCNEAQFAYLKHELQETRKMYQSIASIISKRVKESQRAKKRLIPLYSTQEIQEIVTSYQKRYLPQMELKEANILCNELKHFQVELDNGTLHQIPVYYACHIVRKTLAWRKIALASYLPNKAIVKEVDFLCATLFYRKQTFYLNIKYLQNCQK